MPHTRLPMHSTMLVTGPDGQAERRYFNWRLVDPATGQPCMERVPHVNPGEKAERQSNGVWVIGRKDAQP